jgi:hypothetical protein
MCSAPTLRIGDIRSFTLAELGLFNPFPATFQYTGTGLRLSRDRLTLSGREACGRTLTKRTRASFKRAFFHVDAIHSASRATMAAAAEQLAAELKRVDHPLYVIEGLVRCPFILLLLWATCKRLVVSQALTG